VTLIASVPRSSWWSRGTGDGRSRGGDAASLFAALDVHPPMDHAAARKMNPDRFRQ